MPIAEGVAALKSLKSLYEIAKEVRDSNDPEKLRAAAAQMFDLAMAAREQTAALQEERNAALSELAELKNQLQAVESFESKKADFTRVQAGTGAFVYKEISTESSSPYFCANCFQNRKTTIMQPAPGANTSMGIFEFRCPQCDLQTRLPNPKSWF